MHFSNKMEIDAFQQADDVALASDHHAARHCRVQGWCDPALVTDRLQTKKSSFFYASFVF